MRLARLLPAALLALLLAQSAGCKKKGPPLDLPLYPDSVMLASGGNVEDGATFSYHVLLSSSANANQVRNFYNDELVKKLGWKRVSIDVFEDGNLEHTGDFGSNGLGKPRDPTQPGGWVAIAELPNEIRVDLWRSLPKQQT